MCRLETPEDLNYFLSLCPPKNATGPLCSAVASSEDVPGESSDLGVSVCSYTQKRKSGKWAEKKIKSNFVYSK